MALGFGTNRASLLEPSCVLTELHKLLGEVRGGQGAWLIAGERVQLLPGAGITAAGPCKPENLVVGDVNQFHALHVPRWGCVCFGETKGGEWQLGPQANVFERLVFL